MHRAASLVMLMYFLKAYIPNLVENGPVVSYKSKFQFSYVNDLGLRLINDLDLEYLYTSSTEFCICIYKLSGHRLVKFPTIFTVFTFSYRKTEVTQPDIADRGQQRVNF